MMNESGAGPCVWPEIAQLALFCHGQTRLSLSLFTMFSHSVREGRDAIAGNIYRRWRTRRGIRVERSSGIQSF